MILLYIAGIAVILVASYSWVKFVYFIFPTKRKSTNAYINAHKLKMKNDKDYEEYLKWLEKNGEGVPFNKVTTPEEKKAENKIKNLFR
jgi:hypothetical protein